MEIAANLLWEYDEALRQGKQRSWDEMLGRVEDGDTRSQLLQDLFRVAAQHRKWAPDWIRKTIHARPEFRDSNLLADSLRGLYHDQVENGCGQSWDAYADFGLGAKALDLRLAGEPLALGIVLAERYLVEQRIGLGTFGVVYRALDRQTDRQVALKGGWRNSIELAERTGKLLEEEATLLGAARGPGVPELVGLLSVDENPILVLEFIDGKTLTDLMDGGAMTAQEAIRITRSIALVVARSHEHGHIHRDLKPDNVLVRCDGEVFVIDFGIGLREKTQFSDSAPRAGTIRYMAPECIVQNVTAIDARADIWSLGVVLYEMLTGDALFANETKESVWVGSIVGAPLRRLDETGIDAKTKAVVEKCLAPDRKNRFMTMEALASALSECVEEKGGHSVGT